MTSDEVRIPMIKYRSDPITLGALGMLSGAVVWALGYLIDLVHLFGRILPLVLSWMLGRSVDFTHFQSSAENILYALGPGLIFGVIIGSLLHRRGKAAGWRLAGYVVASALASLGAIYASLYFEFSVFGFPFGRPGAEELAITGFVGGLVWSVVLGLASIPLLRVPARFALGLPVVIGSAFGFLLSIIWLARLVPHYGDGLWSWASFALFTL